MATIRKEHSRAAPIVENGHITPSVAYKDGKLYYSASIRKPADCAPYAYFELLLTRAEMLFLTASWLEKMRKDDVPKI